MTSTVEPWAFTSDLKPPTRALRPIIPDNACHLRTTRPPHVVSRGFLIRYRQDVHSLHVCSSLITEFYDPKTFITHAALLRQAFAHCGRFPTAASRRSLDRVSVPVWPITLSGRLRIVALVSRYLTN